MKNYNEKFNKVYEYPKGKTKSLHSVVSKKLQNNDGYQKQIPNFAQYLHIFLFSFVQFFSHFAQNS